MTERNRVSDKAFGVFDVEDQETVGKAIMVGVFTGSLWSVMAFRLGDRHDRCTGT